MNECRGVRKDCGGVPCGRTDVLVLRSDAGGRRRETQKRTKLEEEKREDMTTRATGPPNLARTSGHSRPFRPLSRQLNIFPFPRLRSSPPRPACIPTDAASLKALSLRRGMRTGRRQGLQEDCSLSERQLASVPRHLGNGNDVQIDLLTGLIPTTDPDPIQHLHHTRAPDPR
ncbi:hypothetical protein FA95DRAFT_84561 [Auriscalpium vulgare]|uniref:Uncharacterized protein n=1 Tax=Auriscalpium vulgare TaxID=40419 RepID=A0ACB8RP39_9AGAM|nr:hypothetical protein FA95DRAFT_84561 [Auriscalpium vulgare]